MPDASYNPCYELPMSPEAHARLLKYHPEWVGVKQFIVTNEGIIPKGLDCLRTLDQAKEGE